MYKTQIKTHDFHKRKKEEKYLLCLRIGMSPVLYKMSFYIHFQSPIVLEKAQPYSKVSGYYHNSNYMEATTFLTSPTLYRKRVLSINIPSQYQRRNYGITIIKVVNEKKGDDEGKSVDKNMIVLRMRIKKIKMSEASSSSQDVPNSKEMPNSNWKEWEKKYSRHYQEDICAGVGILQSYLMNTRPGVALGMLTLIALSVPLSTSVVLINVFKVAKGLLAGSHVSIDVDF